MWENRKTNIFDSIAIFFTIRNVLSSLFAEWLGRENLLWGPAVMVLIVYILYETADKEEFLKLDHVRFLANALIVWSGLDGLAFMFSLDPFYFFMWVGQQGFIIYFVTRWIQAKRRNSA